MDYLKFTKTSLRDGVGKTVAEAYGGVLYVDPCAIVSVDEVHYRALTEGAARSAGLFVYHAFACIGLANGQQWDVDITAAALMLRLQEVVRWFPQGRIIDAETGAVALGDIAGGRA
jgi:hypothetical protein